MFPYEDSKTSDWTIIGIVSGASEYQRFFNVSESYLNNLSQISIESILIKLSIRLLCKYISQIMANMYLYLLELEVYGKLPICNV